MSMNSLARAPIESLDRRHSRNVIRTLIPMSSKAETLDQLTGLAHVPTGVTAGAWPRPRSTPVGREPVSADGPPTLSSIQRMQNDRLELGNHPLFFSWVSGRSEYG